MMEVQGHSRQPVVKGLSSALSIPVLIGTTIRSWIREKDPHLAMITSIPMAHQLGLCSRSEVLCNDKLVGVYDFVEDDPGTVETEENNNGKDNSGHGSHVRQLRPVTRSM